MAKADRLTVNDCLARCEERQSVWVQLMLGGQNACGQRFGRVAVDYGDGGLADDGTSVHFGADDVDGAASDADAVSQSAFVGMKALI